MKHFFYKLVIFFLPVLLFMIVFDYFFSLQLAKTNLNEGEFEVWEDVYEGKIDAKIAIYGSSRAWVHFNPKIIENTTGMPTYNFGVDGQNFEIQYLRHINYFSNNNKPKIIVFSLDVFTLEQRNQLYNSDQFLPYMFLDARYYQSLSNVKNFNFYDFSIPSARYFGKYEILYKLFDSNSYKKYRLDGFRANNRKWIDSEILTNSKTTKLRLKLDHKLLFKFKETIIALKNQGIKPVFVYTPEYIEGQSVVTNRKQILRIFKTFSKSEHIPFLDYSRDSISFHKSLFYNSQHLNSLGSTIFSIKFSKDLLKVIQKKS